MSSNNLATPAEILQKFYAAETIYMAAAPSDRDFSGMAACLSPEMKLYQSPDLPWGGVYEGVDGFRKWGEAMASYFDQLEVLNPVVMENKTSDSVAVMSTLKLRVRKTGVVWERPLVQAVKVDRERSVITEIRPFYWDVKGLNHELGL